MSCCDDHNHDHDHDEEMFQMATIGKKFENFKLTAYDPTEGGFVDVELADNWKNGQWTVLVFYPADFTFVCPTELADLADKHAELKDAGVEVMAVSTDTHFAHLAWQTTEKLLENVKFKMLGDAAGFLSNYCGVYDHESGLDLRGTFIIDPDGVLVGAEVNFFNVGRNMDELVRKVQAFQYVRENPAEACPAKWTPGAKSLTPSEAIVGNVWDAMNKE